MPKANFNFTFDRFVEHHDKGIKDSLVKIRKPSSFNLNLFPEGANKIKTPLTHSELNVAWSFFEDNFEILEDIIYDHITSNYIDAHEGTTDTPAYDVNKEVV